MSFRSSHNLKFEVAPWEFSWMSPELNIRRFKIGTCHGLWGHARHQYQILAIENDVKGNGHFNDVIEIFENSCKRDKMDFVFLEIANLDFYHHLINKRGFVELKTTVSLNAIKYFRK